MMEVGLGYLTLNRVSSTLSGGETQRINLTRTLGSNLTQSLYILDEPSVGLHPKDTENLVRVLKRLRDLGNTVVVVAEPFTQHALDTALARMLEDEPARRCWRRNALAYAGRADIYSNAERAADVITSAR